MLDFAAWLEATPLSITIQTKGWVIPLVQSIHILMIGIVFVSILMIALRVLGKVRMDQAFAEVWNRFSPWMWTALVVMVLTGIVLVIGEPLRQFASLSFWLKMTLLAIGVVSAVVFGRALRSAATVPGLPVGDEPQFSTGTRAVAIVTVVLWLAIIFLGRAIAYDVEVWGSWSLAL